MHSVFATGWNDYKVELGAGYELLRTNSSSIKICRKNDGFVVPARMVGLNVHKKIILGRVESSPLADIPSVPGFFIINMKTGSVRIGAGRM